MAHKLPKVMTAVVVHSPETPFVLPTYRLQQQAVCAKCGLPAGWYTPKASNDRASIWLSYLYCPSCATFRCGRWHREQEA